MSWIVVWIVFVALTATSAYRYPYSPLKQYLGQHLEYQTVEESLQNKTNIIDNYQQRPENVQSVYQEHRRDSSLWRPKTPIARSESFEYYGKGIQDEGRISPRMKNIQRHNGHSSFKISNSLPKIYVSVANERGAVDLDRSLYSRDSESEGRNIFIPQISEECEKLGICENSPDYPHEYVEALLAKLPKSNIIFNLDKEPEIPNQEHQKSNQIVPLCKPNARIIYPDKVRTKMGNWVFVVNGKNNKVQGFSGTRCVAPGKHCDHSVTFINNFRPTCVEKGTDRSMWALDDKGKIVLVTASIPSCCICELRKI